MLDIPSSYTVQATHPERPQLLCHVILVLANNGLGSAIIKRYEVYVDGKLVPVMSRTELEAPYWPRSGSINRRPGRATTPFSQIRGSP
jgi:hypothetical protein